MIVAIDGPVGVGKTTVARAVARRLGLLHIDTGAMYRALAWKCLEEDLDPADPEAMADLARGAHITLEPAQEGPRVFCNLADVTEAIRSPEVTSIVSQVSSHPGLREIVVDSQRRIGKSGSCVMEGRDIGTVVFPDANVKIYLDADREIRARRRHLEMESKGIPASLDEVRKSILERDHRDMNRENSPLRVPENAEVLDTTNLIFEQVVAQIMKIIRRKIRKEGGDQAEASNS